MKVFVKTLKGTHFEIEVKPEDTVADVKKNIETTTQAIDGNVYPAEQQMLIHQGKILKDDTTLDENKVSENSFIVIMLSKAKGSSSGSSITTKAPASQDRPSGPSGLRTGALDTYGQDSQQGKTPPSSTVPPSPSPPPSTPSQVSASNLVPVPSSEPTPTAIAAPSLASTIPTTIAAPLPAITASTETDVYGQAAANLVAGSNFEQAIQHILDMGGGTWDRDTVVRALRAAYNNPERAVEYLYSGIPEHAEAPPVAQPPADGQSVNLPVQAPPPVQPAVPSSGPNANPLDLFPQGLPSMGSNAGAGNLDFLRNSPQFRALQAMVQANPQILQPMLQELGKQNPNVMRLIQEHQTEFLRLINEPAEGAESNLLGQLAGGIPQALTVTPEEREAIERLEALGFDQALVLEVFFACNRNEELAANYLLDHMHEFED